MKRLKCAVDHSPPSSGRLMSVELHLARLIACSWCGTYGQEQLTVVEVPLDSEVNMVRSSGYTSRRYENV